MMNHFCDKSYGELPAGSLTGIKGIA